MTRIGKAALFCTTIVASTITASAERSNVEVIAGHTGRIIGAAKACGVSGDRLNSTTERAFAIINTRSRSKKEAGDATTLFVRTMGWGADEVTSGKTRCTQVRASFDTIEQQFSTAR